MESAQFIWLPDAKAITPRPARITHAWFRKVLTLTTAPKTAAMHLWAATNYHLIVNGATLGYGPIRGYPQHPEFDSYDLAPHLRPGRNKVEVHVAHIGYETFHHLATPGAFIAWGSFTAGAKTVTFDTPCTPGAPGRDGWQVAHLKAFDPMPSPWSFAIGPIQIADERLGPVHAGDKRLEKGVQWHQPAVVDRAAFGPLRPRSIPHLTQRVKTACLLHSARGHVGAERIINFRACVENGPALPAGAAAIAFAHTWVHSPRAQEVPVGLWWGEHWLNGKLIQKQPASADRPGRQSASLRLKKGWNFLFVSCGYWLNSWEFFLAIPDKAGLEFSAAKAVGQGPGFQVAGPLDGAKFGALAKKGAAALAGAAELASYWRDTPLLDPPSLPSRAVGWRELGEKLPLPAWKVTDLIVPPAPGPTSASGGTSLIFDMGLMTLGRVFVDYTAPAGTVLDLAYAEEMHGDRPHHQKAVVVHGGDRQIVGPGAPGGSGSFGGRFESFHPRGTRHIELSITGHRRPVTIHRVGMIEQRYPHVRRGWFQCSDPALNTLWEYGWNTLCLCSEDVITDTPWRERTLYAGDLLPEMATTQVASGDLRLPRRCVEVFLQSQNPATGNLAGRAPASPTGRGIISDYPLLTVIIAQWLYRLTKDRSLLERACPVFDRLMAEALAPRRADGVFALPGLPFIDHGYQKPSGALAAYQALMSRALASWADLQAAAGRAADARRTQQLARQTAQALHRHFWDARAGLYADAIMPDGRLSAAHSIVANSWVLMFAPPPGTTPETTPGATPGATPGTTPGGADRAGRITAAFAQRMPAMDPRREPDFVSTYGAFYYLGGLYNVGAAGLAEQHMRIIYQLMLTRPTGTIWEQAHPDKSLSHAWSTACNYYLSSRALGVRLGYPDAADLGQVVLEPESGTLDWARGVVPHPRGLVEVDWRIEGDCLRLRCQAPAGVKVRVAPRGRLGGLRVVRDE